jgi:hypothetical protein
MLENILGRKFELHPVQLKENQIHCDFCSGTGWVLRDEKWLESCPRCSRGVIDVCPSCGAPYEARYIHRCKNPECINNDEKLLAERRQQEELKRYESAEHLEPTSSFEALFSENYSHNEGYFFDWTDFFEDWCDNHDDNDPRPTYVWSTYPVQINLDAYCIVENATEELWEGALDSISDSDMKELQEYLNKWCENQTGTTTYYPDYSKTVRIPWEEY